jgi:predicted glycosyltransferase
LKVWLDALTPKQGRLAACLHRSLRRAGHETLVTCREHECTASMVRLYGVEPVVVGRYGGETKLGKLLADAERVRELAELVSARGVQALVSYPNPSAARVAFGLGIPYVALNDTPHADAANRLSLPLCAFLVASEALEGRFDRYLAPGARVLYYRGVDEVLWVRGFEPTGSSLRELGLERRGYVVVRPEEYKAAYYSWEGWGWLELCEELRRRGLRVVVLPRYGEQRAAAEKAGFAVPRGCVDGLDLAYHALAVVTGGGTMAREAALLGTPSYYTFPLELEVSAYVERLGFPLKRWSGSAGELAEEIASLERSEVEEWAEKARERLAGLEAPDAKVLEALRALGG